MEQVVAVVVVEQGQDPQCFTIQPRPSDSGTIRGSTVRQGWCNLCRLSLDLALITQAQSFISNKLSSHRQHRPPLFFRPCRLIWSQLSQEAILTLTRMRTRTILPPTTTTPSPVG